MLILLMEFLTSQIAQSTDQFRYLHTSNSAGQRCPALPSATQRRPCRSAAQRCPAQPSAGHAAALPSAAKAQALPRPKRCPAAIPSAAQQSRSAALGSATYYPAYRTQRLSKTRARESSAQTQRCREIRNAQRCREIRNAQRCL